MKFNIPFTIRTIERLKEKSRFFNFQRTNKNQNFNQKLGYYLNSSNIKITTNEYLAICRRSFIIFLIFFFIISTTIFTLLKVKMPFLISLILAFILSFFVYANQRAYPRIHNIRRIKNIEKNLIPALGDMLVQLNSGIPLFSILVNISSSNYGELSEEFKKAVKKINAGFPQMEVLEELGETNSSIYFKRTLWQLSNGMRAGSDIFIVIEESIKSLNEEQLLQIQNYGNKLNPLVMFYMLITVILPALAITFLTVISSIINMPKNFVILLFIGLFIFVILLQIMFLGIIKSIRPSLL